MLRNYWEALRKYKSCHSEPFVHCHSFTLFRTASEGVKWPKNLAQGRLREESISPVLSILEILLPIPNLREDQNDRKRRPQNDQKGFFSEFSLGQVDIR